MKKILLVLGLLLLLPSVHAILYVNALWENELDKATINYGESIKFSVYAQTTAQSFNYVKALLLDSDYNIIHTFINSPQSGKEYLASFDVIKSLYKKAGEFHVVFESQDNTGETHYKFIDLTIINHAPKITSTPITNAKQGVEYKYQVTATDQDIGDVLTYAVYRYNATGVPEGMTINPIGLITWIPTNAQALIGQEKITVIVKDENNAKDEQSFTINIENVNDAPILNEIGNKLVNENQLLTFKITATDPDNDKLTYTVSGLPKGAIVVNQTDGLQFSWTPNYEQSGIYHITFTVSDGKLTDSETITITVNNVNRAPVLNEIGNKQVNENQLLTFTVSASDPDNDSLTYSASPLPQGAAFSNKVFSWTPNYEQSGTYQIKFTVSDGNLEDSETITITVGNTNRAPVIDSFSPLTNPTIKETESQLFSIIAHDPDEGILSYEWYFDNNKKSETNSFSYTSDYESQGTHKIKVIISDNELSIEKEWTLNVINVGRAPVLDKIGNKQIDEGKLLQFTLSAEDPDNDALIYSTSQLPQGAFLLGNTFKWTPDFSQQGNYEITFTVSDGQLTDSETITITVGNVNQPPVLAEIGNKFVKENQLITFKVTATDPDNDPITYTTSKLPEGAVFEAQIFSWIPNYEQSGGYKITFIVSDGQLTDSETITITVGNTNRGPKITSTPITAFETDGKFTMEYRYDVDAIDPDNDPLNYSLITAPEGMKINEKTGLITWVPARKQLGLNNVVVQVSDETYSDTQSFTINIVTERIELAKEKIHISSLQIINDELMPNEVMLTNIAFTNEDNYDMDASVTISIPDLAVRKRVRFALDAKQQATSIIPLEIPDYAEPGEYFVTVEIYDGIISRTKYRFVNII